MGAAVAAAMFDLVEVLLELLSDEDALAEPLVLEVELLDEPVEEALDEPVLRSSVTGNNPLCCRFSTFVRSSQWSAQWLGSWEIIGQVEPWKVLSAKWTPR